MARIWDNIVPFKSTDRLSSRSLKDGILNSVDKLKQMCLFMLQVGQGIPCEDMPKMTTIVRRFMRTKLGTIFTLVICIAVGLFVVNYAGGLLSRSGHTSAAASGAEYDSPLAGRGLAGFEHGARRQGRRRPATGSRLQVCKVPKLSLDSDANKHAYHTMPPLACHGEQLFYVHMGNLHINHTVLGGRKLERCEFRSIEWVNDNFHTYSKTYVRKHEPFDIRVIHDFFRVECFLDPKHKVKKVVDNEVNEYHARRLLQAKEGVLPNIKIASEGEIVNQNSPNLVGSFGVPDIANNVLKNHVQNAAPHVMAQKSLVEQHDLEPKVPSPEKSNHEGSQRDSQVLKQKQAEKVEQDVNKAQRREKNQSNQVPKEQHQHQHLQQQQQQQQHDQQAEVLKPKILKEDPQAEDKPPVKDSVEEKDVNAGEELDDEEQRHDTNVKKDDDDDAENQKNLENYEGGDPFDYNFEGQADPPDFDQFIAQIHAKDEVLDRLKEIKPSKLSLGMNVLIFALDSMSHLSYQRKLPKTYSYLNEVLNTIVFNGYNIVGDATTAALIPLLTGKSNSTLGMPLLL